MIEIKLYKEKCFYTNRWGDKEYLDGGEHDDTLVKAALLTGKGLSVEREYIFTAYGENKEEAEKSIFNFYKLNKQYSNLNQELINHGGNDERSVARKDKSR